MPPAQGIEGLVRDLTRLIDADTPPERCAAVARERCAAVLKRGLVLDAEARDPGPGPVARRLLHRDPRGHFAVVAVAWAPGAEGPAAEAPSWAVLAVAEGTVEVEAFDLAGDGPSPGTAVLRSRGAAARSAGSAEVLPVPGAGAFRVRNPGGAPAVTLLVSGAEESACRTFDPATGRVGTARLRYAGRPGETAGPDRL